MKKLLSLFALLFSINSQAQMEFIGHRIDSPAMYYDNIVYQSDDTLIVSDELFINFIATNDTVTHILLIHSSNIYDVIEESLNTMVPVNDGFYFEYDEGLYFTYLIELEDENYFAQFINRVE
jgi:hypothetical protein